MAQMVKNVCSVGNLASIPGSGRSQEKGKATRSSILAWRIPWTEEPAVHGVAELDLTERLTLSLSKQINKQCCDSFR